MLAGCASPRAEEDDEVNDGFVTTTNTSNTLLGVIYGNNGGFEKYSFSDGNTFGSWSFQPISKAVQTNTCARLRGSWCHPLPLGNTTAKKELVDRPLTVSENATARMRLAWSSAPR